MPKYSLQYFEDLFGGRTPGFWELVEALIAELESYAEEVGPSGREGAVATGRLRHDHRPAVTNLRLTDLMAAEEGLKRCLEAGGPGSVDYWTHRVTEEARAAAQALTSERPPTSPGLRSPSPGD